jgi:hypothetical protein
MSGVKGALGGVAVGLMNNMEPDAALDWLKRQTAEYGAQYDALAAMRKPNGDMMYTNEQIELLLQGNVAETQAWAASLDKVASGVDPIKKAFDDLKSKVSSMLQEGLSPDVSIADGILPRTDDINENARRLAAIANEGIGDQSWMEEFKNEAPGIFDEIVNAAHPQAAAARIFQEFQLGLRPELMDKELIKQRIKDAILGEQKMDALATEIATELSASMGISLPAALKAAQEALGVAPTGADTDKFGEGFEEGIDAQATAAGSIAKIAKAFLDNQSSVKSSGAVVGAWWGEGFMAVVGDNVPPGLLDMMTVKLLPYILSAMANASSTSGTSDGN